MEQQRARMEARRARRKLEKLKKQQKAQQGKVVQDLRSDPPPSKPSNASKNTGTSKSNNPSNSTSQANKNSGTAARKSTLNGLKDFGNKLGNKIGNTSPNKEGDTKTVNGRKFVYRGGSWKPDYRY